MKRSPGRRGVMLVDVIVATVMAGAALAVIIGLSSRAMTAQRQGEDLRAAAMLIDEQLNLVLARGPDDYGGRFPVEGACDAPFERFRFRLDISGGDGGEAYRVVATVTWPDAGVIRSAVVETRIAPRLGDEPDPERRPEETINRL